MPTFLQKEQLVVEFTGIKGKMMAVLSDGYVHPVADLFACLEDELAPVSNIAAHLTAIRKVIRPEGYDVACHRNGQGTCYVLVRMIQR